MECALYPLCSHMTSLKLCPILFHNTIWLHAYRLLQFFMDSSQNRKYCKSYLSPWWVKEGPASKITYARLAWLSTLHSHLTRVITRKRVGIFCHTYNKLEYLLNWASIAFYTSRLCLYTRSVPAMSHEFKRSGHSWLCGSHWPRLHRHWLKMTHVPIQRIPWRVRVCSLFS